MLHCYNATMLQCYIVTMLQWHSAALGLKVSHIQSIQCSIQVLSLSWYPKELLFIYTVIHKGIRAWWAL